MRGENVEYLDFKIQKEILVSHTKSQNLKINSCVGGDTYYQNTNTKEQFFAFTIKNKS